jgi:hypothetical protein
MWTRVFSRPEVRCKITWHVIPHADDELPAALLRDAQFPRILNLLMNTVASQTARMKSCASHAQAESAAAAKEI